MTDGPIVQQALNPPTDRKVKRCCCCMSVRRGVRLMGVGFTTILLLSALEIPLSTPQAGVFGVIYSLPFAICFFISECKNT